MLKKTITYEDFLGTERTEDFYFNLSKHELAELELTTSGGLQSLINRIVNAKDTEEIFKLFKRIIRVAYGVPSGDGRRFEKSEEIFKAFEETNAYDNLFMTLGTNAEEASAFINGIMPQDLVQQASNNVVALPTN